MHKISYGHFHGISTNDVGATLAVAQNNDNRAEASPAPTGIGNIVGSYKSLVANACLDIFKSKNEIMGRLWQRNYYEHIIRNEADLNDIRQYILNNPTNWQSDRNNPGLYVAELKGGSRLEMGHILRLIGSQYSEARMDSRSSLE